MERLALIEAAQKYLGVLTRRGQRSMLGIDCIGLVTQAIVDCGGPDYDTHEFRTKKVFTGEYLLTRLDKLATPVDVPQTGDILVFWVGARARAPQHLGLMIDDKTFIHAYATIGGRVIIDSLKPKWKKRLVAAYKIKEIED